MASFKSPQPAHSYILLRKKGDRLPGQLLELKSNGRYSFHVHGTERRYRARISASSDEVAALTEEECCILDAINSPANQYSVYRTPGKLAWGLALKVGDTVLAKLPPKGGHGSDGGRQQDLYIQAVIRWCGKSTSKRHLFGVEITVSVHCQNLA